MTSRPTEPLTWTDAADPEAVIRDLREQLAAAKAHMGQHREQMIAAGLTLDEDDRPQA